MESKNEYGNNSLIKVIRQLIGLVGVLTAVVILLFCYILFQSGFKDFEIFTKKAAPVLTDNSAPVTTKVKSGDELWAAPEELSLENNPAREKILYGKRLVSHTALFFGPSGTIKKNATNGMNCQNCHLDAGTKPFGNNYGSVNSTYPRYRPRSGSVENLHKRINDCFERSLNGQPLDTTSKEMEAMTAYINWLGKDVPKGKKAAGSGLKDLPFLNRAADPDKGKIAYEARCVTCHMKNGEGQINGDQTAYTYPPLWGNNSYNSGAGLYRLSSFAKYIKYNMPQGTMHENPLLSDEEAWDIAAFVNSQPRPGKNISKDWPKIKEKPFDHPFGPYADGFNEQEHKYGPFQPIKEKLEALNKK